MATFINKKERVFDIELTSYGRYLMSIGKFKPAYYAFYDDNILYDKNYANSSADENQNSIDERIKDTQYIGSLVLFRDVEETLNNGEGASDWYNQTNITARQQVPATDVFKFDAPIGDAVVEGMNQNSPAWKVVGIQGKFTSTEQKDLENDSMVPQINMTANYRKKIVDAGLSISTTDYNPNLISTEVFADNKRIILEYQHPMCYIEEVNSPLYNNNFDVEIYEVLSGSDASTYTQLKKMKFANSQPQIVNGIMRSATSQQLYDIDLTSDDVEYYFNFNADQEISKDTACKAATYYNKKSYYVDLDFDCEETENTDVFYDIYGSTSEPPICQD